MHISICLYDWYCEMICFGGIDPRYRCILLNDDSWNIIKDENYKLHDITHVKIIYNYLTYSHYDLENIRIKVIEIETGTVFPGGLK